MSATYQIRDEPVGGQRGGFVIEPFWALLAIMVGGAWLAALLFAVNAWFLRGPHWQRELALCAGMLLGAAVLFLIIEQARVSGVLPMVGYKYALLCISLWKIGVAYALFFLQQTGYSLYEYFGGKVQQGLIIVLIGSFIGRRVVLGPITDPLLRFVLS